MVSAIPKMLSLANEAASNPSNQQTVSDFVVSLRELLASIHAIQEELNRGIDVPEQDEDEVDAGMKDEEDSKYPPSAMTAHERMMRKNLERMRSQPRYIGGLGKRVLSTPRTPEDEPQASILSTLAPIILFNLHTIVSWVSAHGHLHKWIDPW